jgi:hypothetical protein
MQHNERIVNSRFKINFDALANLDVILGKVRQSLPQFPRNSITNARLIEILIQTAYDDLEKHGEKAELIQSIKQFLAIQAASVD